MLTFRPDPAEFAALAKEHAIVPVWCEVVADTLTPVAAFANLVGDGDGFLFESVEGGERWGRYSFVGRRPLATLTARGSSVDGDRPAGPGARRTRGSWRPSRPSWPASSRRRSTGSRRCTEGWSGISATTWCARSSASPTSPPDDLGHPDAALVVIGQFAAFDHWRQRIVAHRQRGRARRLGDGRGPTAEELAAAYDAACARLVELAADCARTRSGRRWSRRRATGSRRPRPAAP